MNCLLCLLLVLVPVFAAGAADAEASAQAVRELDAWLKHPRAVRGAIGGQGFAGIALTKENAARAKASLWTDHAAHLRATRKAEMDAKQIELDGKTMKFEILRFGDRDMPPKGGRSLFISMHGGGGAPPAVNESQWKNQVRLGQAYKPSEGLYLAPRAPTDTWNLWHEAHIDRFFARLIENLVVLENVNPDRVYILGYSAGGDGVYQLAPRMADRWAAAAMMAGHPNETEPAGLRNVPFALQVGGNDAAYKRNLIAAEWKTKLEALRRGDPKGYEHFVEVHAGKPHWMDLEDRKAIPWMEKFTRNPLPEKIVWRQDDVLHPRFYWLEASLDSVKAGDEIRAERSAQKFSVSAKPGTRVRVLLNDALADLDQPILLSTAELDEHVPVARTIGTLARTLAEYGDPELMFSAEVKVPAK